MQARFLGLLRDCCTRCRAILWQAMPGFGGFPGLSRALPRRRALLGFFPFGKSRLLRNTYKCKPFLRIAYDLLGLHKISACNCALLLHINKRLFSRINSIFNMILSVWPLFCVLRAFASLPLCLYGFVYLALYGLKTGFKRKRLFPGLPCLAQLDRALLDSLTAL